MRCSQVCARCYTQRRKTPTLRQRSSPRFLGGQGVGAARPLPVAAFASHRYTHGVTLNTDNHPHSGWSPGPRFPYRQGVGAAGPNHSAAVTSGRRAPDVISRQVCVVKTHLKNRKGKRNEVDTYSDKILQDIKVSWPLPDRPTPLPSYAHPHADCYTRT